ncbi:MAG: hypothetical protein ABJM29_07545 [Rhizobiaceae bacterium]
MVVAKIADELLGPAALQKIIDALGEALADEIRQHLEMKQVPSQVMAEGAVAATATVHVIAETSAIDALHQEIETIIEGLSP